MEFLIFWLLFGLVSAIIASSRGRSGCGWFLLGFLLGPFGLLVALLPKVEKEGVIKKCPQCAEMVKPEAKICRYCGYNFEQEERKEGPALADRLMGRVSEGKEPSEGKTEEGMQFEQGAEKPLKIQVREPVQEEIFAETSIRGKIIRKWVIRLSLLIILGSVILRMLSTFRTSSLSSQTFVWVKASSANIRNGPSTENKVIAGARRNDKLLWIEERIKRDGNWYKVKLPDGTVGWIYESLCSLEKLKGVKKVKPASRYKKSKTTSLGKEAILKAGFGAFTTKQALKQFADCPSSDAADTLRDLVFSGQAILIHSDTRVRILETGWYNIKVRILEGPHQGEIVWVHRNFLE